MVRIQKFVNTIRYLRRRSRLQSQLLINTGSRAICRVEGRDGKHSTRGFYTHLVEIRENQYLQLKERGVGKISHKSFLIYKFALHLLFVCLFPLDLLVKQIKTFVLQTLPDSGICCLETCGII